MRAGRVLARDADQLRIRCEGRSELVAAIGGEGPGDWVQLEDETAPRIVAPFRGVDFPSPSSETARLDPGRITGLRARATVLAEIRRYFSEQQFLEIEAPTMVRAPGLEVNIRAVEAEGGYLITSPEYAMKRLLAGGLQKIFAMPRCFRSEEEGGHHGVEFTMLEWYRSFDTLESIMADTEALVRRTVRAVRGKESVMVGGREVSVASPWKRMRVQDAFAEWAGIELLGDESASTLADKAVAAGVEIGSAHEWDDIFYSIFLQCVQPRLDGLSEAVLLIDWPNPLAALARTKPGKPEWALRFEAYVGGVELANAFDELTDPVEQRRRFEAEQDERRRRGLDVYPIDEKFMAALEEGLPPCAGIALGVDRLAMLAAGATSLRGVSAFVADEL
ncbi:MAG: EF-P lysine aminoacylase GenX [Myxococcales bacterium]|nr:EF-P lysine aminoacylase GenX [Myxococcales bacterium]